MFDSMHMHSPTIVILLAVALLVLIGGLFVALRVAGQHAVEEDHPFPPVSDHPDSLG